MNKKFIVAAALLFIVAFAIPIEHKYDKLFRFFSLTLIPEGLDVSANYERKIFFYPSDLIALVLLFIGLFWVRIPANRFFGHPLWIILICAIGSIIASPFVNYPIAYIRLLQLLTPITLFSFLAFAFSEEERSKITRWLFIAIIAAGLFQSGVAIAQYFHQAPLGLRLLGETNQISYFLIQDGSRWIFDRFFSQTTEPTIIMRAAGTLPHANVLGGFMVLSIVSTYAMILGAKKWKWILGLTLPFQLFALCISYSRAALLAWFISTLFWFGWILYKNGIRDRITRYIAIFVVLSFGCIATVLLNQFIQRGTLSNILTNESDSVRLFHQKIALQIMKDKPLLGLGFTQFSERAASYFPENTDSYTRSTGPHNIFLFLACETGLISLVALISCVAILLLAAIRRTITVETATFASILIGFLVIGCCDYYLILFQQGKLMFFLVLGLLASHVQKLNCNASINMVKKSAT